GDDRGGAPPAGRRGTGRHRAAARARRGRARPPGRPRRARPRVRAQPEHRRRVRPRRSCPLQHTVRAPAHHGRHGQARPGAGLRVRDPQKGPAPCARPARDPARRGRYGPARPRAGRGRQVRVAGPGPGIGRRMSPYAEIRRMLGRAVTGGGVPGITAEVHDGDRAMGDGRVPGIIAEVRDGDRAWFGTAGVADLATGRKRRPGEHFRIGSLTEAFTAAVVLRLAAEGALTLDDTVATWLPGLAEEQLGADGTAIAVRQLLNHTSGLPDVFPGQETPPPEEPGGFAYSKVNYTLAGMIVEQVTGATLAQEIERRVARPLGLTGTYLPGGDQHLREPHARHYTKESGEIHDVTAADLSWAWAAGGMVSTTADLHTFLNALLRGPLLPAE